LNLGSGFSTAFDIEASTAIDVERLLGYLVVQRPRLRRFSRGKHQVSELLSRAQAHGFWLRRVVDDGAVHLLGTLSSVQRCDCAFCALPEAESSTDLRAIKAPSLAVQPARRLGVAGSEPLLGLGNRPIHGMRTVTCVDAKSRELRRRCFTRAGR
jgi:hypothetical protein